MPDCTRCRCPLADGTWVEHPSLEHCVKALGKKLDAMSAASVTVSAETAAELLRLDQQTRDWAPGIVQRLQHARGQS